MFSRATAHKWCINALPALGLFTALLPDTNRPDKSRESKAAAELASVLGMGSDVASDGRISYLMRPSSPRLPSELVAEALSLVL